MTAPGGDVGEMAVPPLDDRALDALLSGSPADQSGFDWLIPFVEELGEASREPAPVVRPALALLLAEGFAAAPNDVPAPAPRPGGERKRLADRLAGRGIFAKAALGAALVAASATAAGAAGALPGPAQHAVATVVSVATPFTFPDSTGAGASSGKATFGATVSSDATGASDGVHGVDGQSVSDAARAKHDAGSTVPSTVDGSNHGQGVAVGPNTGGTGLDRANETPAAGHVPTSVPAADGKSTSGSEGQKGLSTASTAPGADNRPSGTGKSTTTSTTERVASHS